MKSEIINNFKGIINGVEFTKETVYRSSEYILKEIENKFGEIYNDDFICSLGETIEDLYYKYDDFSFVDLEREFSNCIDESNKFENIEFTYWDSDWRLESFNEKISSGEYGTSIEINEMEL